MAVNGGHAGTKKRPQLGPRKILSPRMYSCKSWLSARLAWDSDAHATSLPRSECDCCDIIDLPRGLKRVPGVKRDSQTKKHRKIVKTKLEKENQIQLFLSFFDPGAERSREPLCRLVLEFPSERPFGTCRMPIIGLDRSLSKSQ